VRAGLAALLLVTAVALGACAANAEIVADRAPPPAPAEDVPRGESGYVWVRGHWAWQGGAWHWHDGHFQRARGNEYQWVDGHWEERGGGRYVWHEGHWQKSAGGGGGRGRVIVHDHGGY
jgi:hypothetical protein